MLAMTLHVSLNRFCVLLLRAARVAMLKRRCLQQQSSFCLSNAIPTVRQHVAWYATNTTDVQQYKVDTVQAQQPNAMPHLIQCAFTCHQMHICMLTAAILTTLSIL